MVNTTNVNTQSKKMPEHLRAYIVITALMAVAYFISKKLFARAVEKSFIERLYAAGFAATSIMFLAHNMWLFLGGLALASVIAARRFAHPLALFVFLFLLMPGFTVLVPGFGLINHLIVLNPWRVLALTLLLPAAVGLIGNQQLARAGSLWADKWVIVFVLFTSLMVYQHYATFTGGLRHLAGLIMDMVLIYFVASRVLTQRSAARHVMVALVAAAIFLALVGIFEFGKHWLLYTGVKGELGAGSGLYGYLARGNTLRSSATTGQPIVLGFIMMVALLACIYVRQLVQSAMQRKALLALMAMGLIAAMSRGPWVGAAVGLTVAALFSANSAANLMKLALASLALGIALVMLPGGQTILNYLPWIGTVDAGNISYREDLFEQALLVISQHLWTGSIGFTELPEFDRVRQGGGFVDIVNSYLGVVLTYGVIGLTLYALLLLSAVYALTVSVLRTRQAPTEQSQLFLMGLAVIVATLVTIWTVSSISHIESLVIFLIGFGAAAGQQDRRENSTGASFYRGSLSRFA